MLSSTVVTVLAPQWSGRLRRHKREGTGTSDFQGNLPDRTNSSSSIERILSNGLQSQPFLRSNTVGWSTRSGPIGLDNERKVHQSVSLDMRLDDKRTDRPIPSPLSPLSPVSPMSIDSHEPQRSPQRGYSPLSSKPTASSMLLSLRKVNNNSPMSPTECQTQSPENADSNRQFSTQLSQTFQHKNQLSPNSISNNGNPPLSPSPTHRDRLSNTYYSTMPSKHTESPYSQANSSQEVASPQRSFSRDPTDSIKLTKKPTTMPKRTPYDHTALLKSHSTPRRPPLSSISWLPIDNQEGSSKITLSDNNNKSNAPFNSNNIKADNAGVNGQIPNYGGNKNIEELALRANLVKLQAGTADTPQHSNIHLSLVKGQVDSCLNREPPKPVSLPNSKFSISAPHTAMSQARAPNNHDASSGLYSAKVAEFSPTLLTPKSSYTPTDNSSKYQNIYCVSKTTPTTAQSKDKVSKPSHLHDITNTVTNGSYKSSLDLGQSNKSSFQSTPGTSQANSSASTFPKDEILSPKLNTPLGFERSYVPKPYQAKTNLNPTVSLYSKTSYSPTHANNTPPASSPSYLSPHSPPVNISSLLTPPATPSFNSPSPPRTPSPKVTKALSSSVDLDPKKQKGEKKISKRVTFEDTVNANTEEKQEQLNQLTQRNVKAPSIFNVLRSGNQPNTFSPTPKSSSIQIGAGVKYRSLSSDSAELKSREMYRQMSSEAEAFDHKKHGLNMPRQERTLSAESAVQYRCSAALSLPPDFANGYKNRYSSPPYSTLVSSRTAQTESKPTPPRSALFQRHSQPNVLTAITNTATALSKPPLLSSSLLPLRPVQIDIQDSLKAKDINLDQVNNNPMKFAGEVLANGQIRLVDNRVQIHSRSLPGDKSPRISSTCVTETLVYSVKGKTDRAIDGTKNATPKGATNMAVSKETVELSQQVQRKEALKERDNMSNLSSSSSGESHNIDDDGSRRKIKEVGKSRFYSIESSSEQSPKRSRFALKKSTSTPNAGLTRSDSERTSKMDQMISRIKQTFTTRKSNNDEESFPKKWKKASQLVPSLSGMSDSSTSENAVESNRTVEEEEVTMELNNNDKGVEDKHRWANNRYTLVPASFEKKILDDTFSMWTDEVMNDPEELSENRSSPHLKSHSPNKDHDAFDFKTNQFLSPKDHSPGYSPNSSTEFGKSSSSLRSPFSPFPALSPVSPLPTPDSLDDSVFYSPKPPRHRDSSSSPCELGEISLVSSRRNRASTGPPSLGPVTSKERSSTSYADLKYGIEPGRSFSVSSVSSSRPSGPGRISTGSRFMSVGDLTKTAFSCGHTASDSDNWSGQSGAQANTDFQAGLYPNDGKVRSRSLPRSFTQCLSSWGTGQSASSNASWSQNMDTVDLPWDSDGPPTPPPTPPMSPMTRRMSKPPSLSPPSFTGQSDPPQDNQSPRGLLPSRGYTSSLSTFEESSDSSSDTTTDDEYYLETGEDEEKETEL